MRVILQSKNLKVLKLHCITAMSFITLMSSENLSHLTQLEFEITTLCLSCSLRGHFEHAKNHEPKLPNLKKLKVKLPPSIFCHNNIPNFVKIIVLNCPNLESLQLHDPHTNQRIAGLGKVSVI